jgi:hypothetical protein
LLFITLYLLSLSIGHKEAITSSPVGNSLSISLSCLLAKHENLKKKKK